MSGEGEQHVRTSEAVPSGTGDSRLLAEFDETYGRVLEHRRAFREEPWLPGQRDAVKANPEHELLNGEQIHFKRVANNLGPKHVAVQLAEEIKAVKRLMNWLRKEIDKEPVCRGQRGAYTENPMGLVLRQTLAHYDGCTRLLMAANTDVPLEDEELARLLDY